MHQHQFHASNSGSRNTDEIPVAKSACCGSIHLVVLDVRDHHLVNLKISGRHLPDTPRVHFLSKGKLRMIAFSFASVLEPGQCNSPQLAHPTWYLTGYP